MDNIPWESALFALAVVVPLVAFVYEFGIAGRKRLGFLVQMDTAVADAHFDAPPYAGSLQRLQQQSGEQLVDPSFVLLSIENTGTTSIDESDYASPNDDRVGIRVTFPGRRIAGMMVTEFSDPGLSAFFGMDSALNVQDDIIELPRVPLQRSDHYKVLVILERSPEATGDSSYEHLRVIGGIRSGAMRRASIRNAEHSIARTPSRAIALIGFLIIASMSVGYLGFRAEGPTKSAGNANSAKSPPHATATQTVTISPSPRRPSGTRTVTISPAPREASGSDGDDHDTALLAATGTFIASLGTVATGVAAVLALLRRRQEND